MKSLRAWLGERLPVDPEAIRALTNEPVPNHLRRWWFALGGTPAYLFVVQIVTGILLAFYYEASPRTAYGSVRYITEDAAFGWYLRGLHRWGATLMIAAVVLHQMRVFFTGAYRRPREVNWFVGMSMLVCTLLLGFTGYSLVYEQLSYWGATVGGNLALQLPWIGDEVRNLLLGGEAYNEHTLARFYVVHAAILPLTLALLVVVHIAIVRLQGVSELHFKGEAPGRTFRFFPDHFYSELIIGLALMVLLSTLAVVFPATLGPEADPSSTPASIKPEWFFYVAFRWLKLFSGTVAVSSLMFVLFLMFVWPLVDAWIRRRIPDAETSMWIGAAAVLAIVALTLWEAIAAH